MFFLKILSLELQLQKVECSLHLRLEIATKHSSLYSLTHLNLSAFDYPLDLVHHLNHFLRLVSHFLLNFALDFTLRHHLHPVSQENLVKIGHILIIAPSTMYIYYD